MNTGSLPWTNLNVDLTATLMAMITNHPENTGRHSKSIKVCNIYTEYDRSIRGEVGQSFMLCGSWIIYRNLWKSIQTLLRYFSLD